MRFLFWMWILDNISNLIKIIFEVEQGIEYGSFYIVGMLWSNYGKILVHYSIQKSRLDFT